MTADYTDYRWRAQGKHHSERHRRTGDHVDYPGLAPGQSRTRRQRPPTSPVTEATYGSPRTRGSMRRQRKEAFHPGHHSQCACLVVKQFTQEMHRRADEENRHTHKHYHGGPPHQRSTSGVNMEGSFGDLVQERHEHRPKRHSDHPEPQVHIPILPNNPWITGEQTHNASKRRSHKMADKVMEGAEMTSRIKHHTKALSSSQPYHNLQSHQPHSADVHTNHGECSPTCACASVREFTRQMNEQQQPHHIPLTPTPMPMHATNPFLGSAKDTMATVGAGARRVGEAATAKLSQGAEVASRQKVHYQAGYSYNRMGSEGMEVDGEQQVAFPMPNTNPFVDDAQKAVRQVSTKVKGISENISSTVQHGAEVVGRARHHAPGNQSYNRLLSDTADDILDTSDPRGMLYSEELAEFIDGSDHPRLGSDTIDNFLDEIDESTFHELKDLDQSSLCELQDLCLQLQTIEEEESEGENMTQGSELVGKHGHHRPRQSPSMEQVPQVKIPVAVVPPRTFNPSNDNTKVKLTKRGKEAGKKVKDTVMHGAEIVERAKVHVRSRLSYEQLGDEGMQSSSGTHDPQIGGRMAIDFPMSPVSPDTVQPNPTQSRHTESQHTHHHDHEHGENCACQVVKRYTAEMERKDRERAASREMEEEDKYGVPQVHIPINPHNPYIAQANAKALREGGQGSKGQVGRVIEKVQEGTEAVSRAGVHIKGNMQYDKLSSFEDDFTKLAINERVKQDRMRMKEDRKKKEMKRSQSLPEAGHMPSVQRGFIPPSNWVHFSEGTNMVGEGATYVTDGMLRGKEAIQRAKVHAQGNVSYSRLRHSEPLPAVVREGDRSKKSRPVSEPAPQVVEDPATGIRFYKAVKKQRRHSKNGKDLPRSMSAPEGVQVETSMNTQNRHSLPQDPNALQPSPYQSPIVDNSSYTVNMMHTWPNMVQVTADVHSPSIFRPKDASKDQHSKQKIAKRRLDQTPIAQIHKHQDTRHSLPPTLDSERVELTEQEKKAQSFHEDPRVRARKQKDIIEWVDNVSPCSSSQTAQKNPKSEITPRQLWPRDYHEANENQLNEISRSKLKRKKKKKSSSKLKHKAGLTWLQSYQSLAGLSEGVQEQVDGEWEDEVEEKKASKKAKRKSFRQKVH